MITPNLSPMMRGFYIAAGIALLSVPFLLGLTGWPKWIMLLMGIPALIEGLAGW